MNMTSKLGMSALYLAATLIFLNAAQAAPMTYAIHVDTSSIAGTNGFVDLQLFPEGTVDTVTASAFGFNSVSALGAPDTFNFGNYSGDLSTTLSLDNGAPLTDFAQNITFTNFFDVFVTIDLPAVTPQPAGTDFYLNVLDSGYAQLLGGPASHIFVGNDGIQTILAGSDNATTSAVPEPASMLLFASGLAAVWMRKRRS